MMKAIIVEDELRSAKLLENLLRDYCPDVQLIGLASSVDAGFQLVKSNAIDIVFLDIEMQKESGFDLLNKFENINFEIIFTTAFEHYALKAIKFSAIDYLLKPIDIEELKAAISKVSKNNQRHLMNKKFEILMQNRSVDQTGNLQIALPSTEGLSIVFIHEILYLKSDRQYTIFVLKSGEKIVTSKNLGEYEDLFLVHNFFRVHHSTMVNLNEVRKYIRGDGGSIVLSNGDQVEVSKRKKEAFISQFTKK